MEVCFGSLTVTKEIKGLENDAEALEKLKQQLTFEIATGDNSSRTVKFSDFAEENGIFSYTINYLKPGISYKVQETNEDLEDYTVVTTPATKEVTGTIVKGENNKAEFTNTYTPAERILTVKKIVTGNMGDEGKDFTFTLTLTGTDIPEKIKFSKKNSTGSVIQEGNLENSDETYVFELKHNESIELAIPYEIEYTISEDAQDYTASYQVGTGGGYTRGNSCSGKMDNDVTITFKNMLDIAPPTGLNGNATPFAMMLLTAVAGGLWFGITCRRKRSS